MSQKKAYYEDDFIAKQVGFYAGLPEKQRRHFLAMEYERLGVGSKRYLARTFGCDRKTINKGLRELAADNYQVDYARQRAVGGGRKKRSRDGGTDELDTGVCRTEHGRQSDR